MGKKVLVEIPEEIHRIIKIRAVESGKSIREMVREAVERYAKGQEKIVVESEDVVNLNEFCKGLTMKECVEKIRREIPNYREKIYSISISV